MSRETDTPSTGPNGRGGAAYPSGTPPYGIPAIPDEATAAGRPAARSDERRPDERKTETTLTTRIRINIPGSRPIPPVVVRKPVTDGEGTDDGGTQSDTRAEGRAPTPGSAGTGTGVGPGSGSGEPPAPAAPGAPSGGSGQLVPQQPAPQQSAPAEKPTSDWFAPRKSGAGKGGTGGGSGNGAGAPSGSGSAAPAGSPAGAPGAPGAGAPGGARPGGRPAGVVGGMSVTSGARPGGPTGTNGSAPGAGGLSGATGGPVAPGRGGTGSFDVTEALAGGGQAGHSGAPEQPGASSPSSPSGPFGPPGQSGQPGQSRPALYQGGPEGPTTGPVTGRGPMIPPRGSGPRGAGGPGSGLSDDTASLTPQIHAPDPDAPGYDAHYDSATGYTGTRNAPVVPASAAFDADDTPAGGRGSLTPSRFPEPAAPTPPPAASSKAPKKKGRSKLPLLGGGVVLLLGVAYGAGLLMNHSDVPKGTTVLGVDIGGGTRDEAVKTLDKALADRLNKPLELAVGDKTVELQPDNAGLQLDTDATVSAAAKSDYNPVSVIGSLFGNSRVVDPEIPVDEEKLQAALEAAGGGSGNDGTITFESGKAVAVYGEPGAGIDVDKSVDAIEAAYRTQVETGSSSPVKVPTTIQEPTVSKAEVDRMMKEYAEPAMSANVTVQTDAAHSVAMSPQKSLWKFLRVEAVDGKLVDKPDLKALEELYGQTFDGVVITRGNGEKTPVTPQDVYAALRQALTSTGDRVAVIETDPS
ncbi:hypothetical protein ACFYY3_10995 [Streptomyces sp. NPDC001812]|uniref:hypothetical protein n=1 Tax=Streptomyces sp. NPDC001812 TaxID=3364611 RepID=UPI0036BA8F75